MNFTLVATTKIEVAVTKKKTKTEDCYSYEGPNGEKVQFHAHPTRAFVWCFVPSGTNADGAKYANRLLTKFVKVMMDAINSDAARENDLDTVISNAVKTISV